MRERKHLYGSTQSPGFLFCDPAGSWTLLRDHGRWWNPRLSNPIIREWICIKPASLDMWIPQWATSWLLTALFAISWSGSKCTEACSPVRTSMCLFPHSWQCSTNSISNSFITKQSQATTALWQASCIRCSTCSDLMQFSLDAVFNHSFIQCIWFDGIKDVWLHIYCINFVAFLVRSHSSPLVGSECSLSIYTSQWHMKWPGTAHELATRKESHDKNLCLLL